jgi:hypothetical protein
MIACILKMRTDEISKMLKDKPQHCATNNNWSCKDQNSSIPGRWISNPHAGVSCCFFQLGISYPLYSLIKWNNWCQTKQWMIGVINKRSGWRCGLIYHNILAFARRDWRKKTKACGFECLECKAVILSSEYLSPSATNSISIGGNRADSSLSLQIRNLRWVIALTKECRWLAAS